MDTFDRHWPSLKLAESWFDKLWIATRMTFFLKISPIALFFNILDELLEMVRERNREKFR